MNLSEILSYNEVWKKKLIDKGHTVSSLCNLIKDFQPILKTLRNDEISDFIFRLKHYHDSLNNKKTSFDELQEIPERASVNLYGKTYYFKLCPDEKSFSSPTSKFYCELCGILPIFKLESIKKHLETFHSQ